MKYFLVIALALIISGCGSKNVVTQEVYIPVRCDISMPIRNYQSDFSGVRYDKKGRPTNQYLEYLKAKIIGKEAYINELTTKLDYCINGIKENE